ncbi:MAG: hypothetical protein LRY53_08965, partial [Burkholderiaceae bacterium]|nr:hypothetical protein [Burkholderiaceae bacterium]
PFLGSAPDDFSFSPTINVGGTGGSGGNAGAVQTSNQGLIRTLVIAHLGCWHSLLVAAVGSR